MPLTCQRGHLELSSCLPIWKRQMWNVVSTTISLRAWLYRHLWMHLWHCTQWKHASQAKLCNTHQWKPQPKCQATFSCFQHLCQITRLCLVFWMCNAAVWKIHQCLGSVFLHIDTYPRYCSYWLSTNRESDSSWVDLSDSTSLLLVLMSSVEVSWKARQWRDAICWNNANYNLNCWMLDSLVTNASLILLIADS